jgi:MFS family permease
VATLAILITQSGSTFWFPLLHDVVPKDQRGRFFGKLRAIWSTTLFLSVIGAGLFLGDSPDTWRFQVVLGIAAGGMLLRNALVARIPEARHALTQQDDFGDWRLHVKNLVSRRKVVAFIVYFCVLGFCIGFLGQPLVLYMKHLGFSPRANVITYGFTPVGMAAALLLGGHLVDRLGTRRVFLATHLILCGVSFALIRITMLPMPQLKAYLSVAFIVAGAVRAIAGLACTAQLFHFAPLQGRPLFLSLGNILIYVGPATSLLLAGYVLDAVSPQWSLQVWGISLDVYQIMLCGAGVAMLLVIGLLAFVEDVRDTGK